jgi:hypothetical protein
MCRYATALAADMALAKIDPTSQSAYTLALWAVVSLYNGHSHGARRSWVSLRISLGQLLRSLFFSLRDIYIEKERTDTLCGTESVQCISPALSSSIPAGDYDTIRTSHKG